MTDTTDTTAPVCDLPADEFFDTLTGFEEIAIKKAFGVPATTLPRTDPTMWIRALVFVHVKRTEGLKDTAAYPRAMGMTLGAVSDYFAPSPEGDAVAAVEADTEGKDAAA